MAPLANFGIFSRYRSGAVDHRSSIIWRRFVDDRLRPKRPIFVVSLGTKIAPGSGSALLSLIPLSPSAFIQLKAYIPPIEHNPTPCTKYTKTRPKDDSENMDSHSRHLHTQFTFPPVSTCPRESYTSHVKDTVLYTLETVLNRWARSVLV